jgi:transcriptional regulator of acetoin/glycerol metabolism
VGVLYVRSEDLRFTEDRDRNALAQFARIAAMVLSAPAELPIVKAGVELYLERTTADDVARQQLLVLLEKNEWNIARVSRLIGVTRATIYNRLTRLGIERRRIPKGTGPGRQPA